MTINTSAQTKPELELCCSFCRKSSEQVNILIAGPGVFICNECVEICNQILRKFLHFHWHRSKLRN